MYMYIQFPNPGSHFPIQETPPKSQIPKIPKHQTCLP